MIRSLPAPRTVRGYRKDGRPIRPALGASADDPSNDEKTITITQKQLSTLLVSPTAELWFHPPPTAGP